MSKIVDVLNADREKHRNHRYGRDYYTKQAGIPSGKRKNKEEGTDFWSFLDEDHYRTTPTSNEDISEISEFDPRLISGYDTENSTTQYCRDDNYNFKITVNKDGLLYYSDDENVPQQVLRENEVLKLFSTNLRSENKSDSDQKDVRVRVNTENLLSVSEEENNNALKVTHLNQQTNNLKELKISVNAESLLFDPHDIENKTTQKEDMKSFDDEGNNIPKIVPRLPRRTVEKNVPKVTPRTNKANQHSFPEKGIINSNLEDATCNSSKTQHPPQNHEELKITVNVEGLLYTPEDNDEGKLPCQDKSVGTKSVVTNVNTNEPKRAPKISKTSSQFSVEDHVENKPVILNKKSDNTLIKKIYSDPVVRSFALTNREQIPVKLDASFKVQVSNTKTLSTQDTPELEEITNTKALSRQDKPKPEEIKNSVNLTVLDVNNNNNGFGINEYSDEEVILDTHENVSSECSDSPPYRRQYSSYKENDLHELQEKHLVANRLGEFSKSFPNLSKFNFTNEEYNTIQPNYEMHIKDIFVSVKDLKKLFENN